MAQLSAWTDMLAEEFINRKRHSWERLTTLLNRSQRGLVNLTADELQEMGRLYRQVTSDLAIVKRDFARHPVCEYLDNLGIRAYGHIYQGKSTRMRALRNFFTHTFPQTFRETWGYTLASFLMFFFPALVSFIIAYRDPEAMVLVMPGIEDVISNIKDGHEWWKSINEEGNAASTSFIMTNNIRVAFMAFAGGVVLGVLSLYILAMNGMLLGSVAGAAQRFDFADNLWGFVAAHGTIELSVIFIAGGAGLQLGWSILRPGLYKRATALKLAAYRAVKLLFGCVPLLVVAGTIEGFISPSNLPLAVKLLVSVGSGVALYGYLILSGRDADVRKTPSVAHSRWKR